MHAARIALATASLLALAACAEQAPLVAPASLARSPLAASTEENPVSGPWARIIRGETGPGALYALYVPRTYNGSAVVYAHGFRDAWSPVDLRDQDASDAIRDQIGALGYAVAYSSFSENGFAVKEGALQTHQLNGLLASVLGGQPERTFLAGHSLGAGIALALAEQHPTQYAGALLMCGMVGGSRVQTDYLGHVRALFDVYFPGRLPGNAISWPRATPVGLSEVIAAVQSNPAGLFAIASMKQTPLPWVPDGSPFVPGTNANNTLVGSLYGALNFHSRGIEDVLVRTNGHSPFGNDGTTYEPSATPLLPPSVISSLAAAANASVVRYTLAPSAANYLAHNFAPTGDLRVPVLTLHNRWDPGVPAFHEDSLAARVNEAGASAMLTRRLVNRYGHCAITPDEATQSFVDLTAWVASKVKPAS